MKTRSLGFLGALVALLALPAATSAGIGNEKGADKGNKTGWTSIYHHGHEMSVPKGLTVSGEKGRVDNGTGNGGEHPGHHTPSHHGEDGPHDEDPN